jgi:hypothetical protein
VSNIPFEQTGLYVGNFQNGMYVVDITIPNSGNFKVASIDTN